MPLPNRKSLRRRLPALIAVPLGLAVVAFAAIAYGAVRRTLISTATLRVQTVAQRFSQNTAAAMDRRVTAARALAADPAIRRFLQGGDSAAALAVLAQLGPDTGALVASGIRDARGRTRLTQGHPLAVEGPPAPLDEAVSPLFAAGDSVEFLIRAPVRTGDSVLGEVVQRRVVRGTAAALQVISGLIGSEGALLLGNADGSLWTDLRTIIRLPPAMDSVTRYARAGRDRLVGTAVIGRTPLTFAVDLPVDRAVAPANDLLVRFGALAVLVIGLGSFAAWAASRRITGPLTDLTRATQAVARGADPPSRCPPTGTTRSGCWPGASAPWQ